VTGRSIALFIALAFAEIGGAYLVWVGIKEHKGGDGYFEYGVLGRA
jgi:small multidrug resistance family-3 protein